MYKHSHEVRVSHSKLPLYVALASVGIMIVSCTVGPDYKRPSMPLAQSYTRDSLGPTLSSSVKSGESQQFLIGADIERQWWTAFGSVELNKLVDQAFKNNPTIESAKATLRQTQENAAAQFGAYFPLVQVGYSASRQKNPVGTLSPTLSSGDPIYTIHTTQLSIGYAPDVFGLNRRAVESLTAQSYAQNFQLQAAYLTLASNVVSAVIQEAALRAQISSAQKIIDADSRSLKLLQRQAELGSASGLDVASQEAFLAQAQQILPPLNKQLEQTRNLMAALTGNLPAEGGKDEFDLDKLVLPHELPISLPSKLVEHRPDIRAAEEQVHAASALVGVALANRLPQFSISAAYGGTSTQFSRMFNTGNTFWGLTGNVAQTVFDFGALKHKQRAAEAALDQAIAQYHSVALTAFQNVADSLYALDADAKGLNAALTSETAATKLLDMTFPH